jgi:hypothetical protein
MEPEDRISDDEILDILEDVGFEVEEDDEPTGPKPLEDDEIESIFSSAISDAVDFIESELSEDRVKSQRYFDGEVDLEHEPGRSKVVATKTRDTVRAIKPSLMRVFLSTSKPVEYIPKGPEDVTMAQQATDYAHWKFQQCNGYRVLSDVFQDALVKRMGVAKAYYEPTQRVEVYTYTGLNDLQYQALIADPDVEVLEYTRTEEASEVTTPEIDVAQPPMVSHDIKISKTFYDGQLVIDSIPPEEFFFDRNARRLDDAYVCGQRTDMRVGDLVQMGFDFDEVVQLDSSTDSDTVVEEEEEARRGYSLNVDEDENAIDPSMKKVMVTEAYMRVDVDGTGIPTLHRAVLGGSAYKLLSVEPADEVPYAVFEIDPEPHTMVGRSIADLTINDQDAATSILRGILDNVAMVNNPRLAIVDGAVNPDDVLNNEIGAVVRMTQPGAVQALAVPFSAGQTLGALQYLDGMVEQKTGVTRASMGLDPDALQSTTKAAVTATVQAAAGQVEVMARNLAEGGMRQLFSLLLRLIVKHADGPAMLRLNGMYQPIDPRVWDTSMDVTVNIGLGTGREEEKAAAYREVLAMQMQVWQAYGPTNGIVSMTGMRNTMADLLASAGIRNSERYFNPMDQQIEQQLLMQAQQQAQQAQQQQGDPNAAFMQAEMMKAQQKGQSDAMKMQLEAQKAAAKHELDVTQFVAEEDRKRDMMAQELALKNAELLGKYGLQANEQAIRAEQERERMLMNRGQS